jgi:hypothetical protein
MSNFSVKKFNPNFANMQIAPYILWSTNLTMSPYSPDVKTFNYKELKGLTKTLKRNFVVSVKLFVAFGVYKFSSGLNVMLSS